MRGRQGGGSRTGTFLVLVGIVGVLTATFVAGVWTGRNWPVLVGTPGVPAPLVEPPAKPARAAAERPRPAETLPVLTFYHDLKAPLTAPPPVPKPVRAARPPEIKHEEPARPEPAAARPRPDAAVPAAADGTPSFTVQVAAYNVKPLAEALRTTLAAAGHDARVVETDRGGSARYRVQVGIFATREAARAAAARLATERSLPTFVTTR